MSFNIFSAGQRSSELSSIVFMTCLFFLMLEDSSFIYAQAAKRPFRASPPSAEEMESKDLFFEDLERVLVGEIPWLRSDPSGALREGPSEFTGPGRGSGVESRIEQLDSGPISHASVEQIPAWIHWISPESIEDLVKESKQRLDQCVRTPSGFAGGGFQQARIEFSLLSLLFGIIEVHPAPVRWKSSSALMRLSMNQAAAGAKVGSPQMFQLAKNRQLDLDTVLRGETIGGEPIAEIEWVNLVDIGPLMQLMSMAFDKHVVPAIANQAEFTKRRDELARHSQLISILSAVATLPEMPFFDDEEFCGIAEELADAARSIAGAIEKNDVESARMASGRMGQSCQKCHDGYR